MSGARAAAPAEAAHTGLIERELEGGARGVRQLELATGIPGGQLRIALAMMADQGKIRVRLGLAGVVIVPVGNN